MHFYGDHLRLIAAPLDSWRGRTQRGDLLTGTSLRQLSSRHGVDLRGRTTGAREHAVSFEDGTELEVETVIWATGFRPDYTWIHAPVLDAQGAPVHRRGVTSSPGLFFLGMKNQYSRGSSLIGLGQARRRLHRRARPRHPHLNSHHRQPAHSANLAPGQGTRHPPGHPDRLDPDQRPAGRPPQPGGTETMMTGTLGIVMWIIMGAMMTGFAGGGIAWLRRRLKRPRTRIRRDQN